MRELLQAALVGDGATLSIEACAVAKAIYLPREGRCNIVYELLVRDGQREAAQRSVVSARLFSSQTACHAYLRDRLTPLAHRATGREEIAPFTTPVTMLESLNMAASIFPLDGDLPTLLGATDSRHMSEVFRRALPAARNGSPIEGCRVEVAQYRRRGRCVLRYHVERSPSEPADPSTFYGKVYTNPCSSVAAEAMTALRARSGGNGTYRFHVPRPVGDSLESRLALLEAIPGKGRITRLVKKRLHGVADSAHKLTLDGALEICARIAATLHTSGISLGDPRSSGDDLTELGTAISAIEPLSTALGEQLLAWHARLARYAESSGVLPACFSHGDFSHSQLLFDGGVGGLVDFDNICQAEPARDLGQFLAYLRIAVRQVDAGAAEPFVEGLRNRFLTAYLSACHGGVADENLLRTRVALYEAGTLLRVGVASWLKFKRERLEHAIAILDSLDFMTAR